MSTLSDELAEKDMDIGIRVGSIAITEIRRVIEKFIESQKERERLPDNDKSTPNQTNTPELKRGKQTLEELKRHNNGLTPLELKDPNLRLLNKEMKKAGIDFAVTKDGKGKYILHFKARDKKQLTFALRRYINQLQKRNIVKPSISKALANAKALAQSLNKGKNKVKNKSRGAR